jgi:hypothetical protein
MRTLWFVMPVHGRLDLTAICLRQLRRTCDALHADGIEATAVVIGDSTNLAELRTRVGETLLGFGTVTRDNRYLSRRFNDGIQLACDPKINPRPADYVVPIGSDDWVDHRILLRLPPRDTVLGFQHMSFVREDGLELTVRHLNYEGGAGIRVYPRDVVAKAGYRPADEDRKRACDTSILTNLKKAHPSLRVAHGRIDPRQLVDWKSPGEQLNTYTDLAKHRGQRLEDPFVALDGYFPAESLDAMRDHYARVPVAA